MKRTLDRSVSRPVGCTDIARDWLADLFCRHHHREKGDQGLGNEIIDPEFSPTGGAGEVNCRERLGGLLRYCYRDAA